MKKTFTTINDLHNWLLGLFNGRPGDPYPRIQHALMVDEIVFELIGLAIWRADANALEVGTRLSMAGNLHETNLFWFTVGGHPYALVYRNGVIALCDRNRSGTVRATFDNTSTRAQLKAAFAAL